MGGGGWWEEERSSWEISEKEAPAYCKNTRCGRSTYNLVGLQFWFSVTTRTKFYYATTQLMLYERTLPTLTTHKMFRMPTLFAQYVLNFAEATLHHM